MAGGDNPVRFLVFNNNKNDQNIMKTIKVKENKLCLRVFFRPLNLYNVKFVLSSSKDGMILTEIDLNLNKHDKIKNVKNSNGCKILGVECNFKNGYYDFSVKFLKKQNVKDLAFTFYFESIQLFEGTSRGIYMNLSTLRKII